MSNFQDVKAFDGTTKRQLSHNWLPFIYVESTDLTGLKQFRRKTIAKTESILSQVKEDTSSFEELCHEYKLSAANWLDLLSSSSWLLCNNVLGPSRESSVWTPPFSTAVSNFEPNSPESYRALNAPIDLWKKGTFSLPHMSDELSLTTKRKLADSEAFNFHTNKRFANYSLYPRHIERKFADALWMVRSEISDLVAPFRPFDTFRFCHHGNGASENSQSPLWKKIDRFSATRWVKDTLGPIYEGLEGYIPETDVVDCERYSEVPKTFKINRPIGIQPSLNLYFQLGLGEWFKRRLHSKWGIDLRNQERNRLLARIGSRDGNFATIDLSSASDTISSEVVEFLFHDTPVLEYMKKLRVQYTSFDNFSHLNQKFSSMGNGFTFELETIIFASIVRHSMLACGVVTTEFNHSVYGDDIIIPVECYDYVVEMLEFFGFSVNKEKSFRDGPFRESCGSDFYNGYPVRSLYSKENHNGDKSLESVIRLANGLYRKAKETTDCTGYDRGYLAAWKHVMRKVPRSLRSRLTGPYVEHDGWFISDDSSKWAGVGLDNIGRNRRLALVSGQRRSKCSERNRLDVWFYLANRRGTVLCDAYGKPMIFDHVVYHPTEPTRHKLTWILSSV